MNNNDVMRRSRYILDLKDNQIVKIFKHVDRTVTDKQVNDWLKREDDEAFVSLSDDDLLDFLDALIIEKRGKKDGPAVRFKSKMDNNLILMKLKIAFALKAEDVLDIMQLADFKISKHELSALFRKKDHKHYRVCKNQILRKFMKGLQIKYRGVSNAMKKPAAAKTVSNTDHNKTSKESAEKPQTAMKGKLKLSAKNEDGATKTNKKANTRVKTVWKMPKKKD